MGCAAHHRCHQRIFELLFGEQSHQTLEEILRLYEANVAQTRERNRAARRVEGTTPSHALDEYVGIYLHPGYGRMRIARRDRSLILQRNRLTLLLQHWHYVAWVAVADDLFEIHRPHPFDRTGRLLFDTNADGRIDALSIQLEPAVAPIRFAKVEPPA